MASPLPAPQRATPQSPKSSKSSTTSSSISTHVRLVRSWVATGLHALIFVTIFAFTSYCMFDAGKRLNYRPIMEQAPFSYWLVMWIECIGLVILSVLSLLTFVRVRRGYALTAILTIAVAVLMIGIGFAYGTGLACVLWPSLLSIVQAIILLPKGKRWGWTRPFVEEDMLPL